jgi:adenosylcobinamide-GDP ribazoletransferase
MNFLGLFKGFRNSLAFLTVLPVGMDEDGFRQAATYMPIFPLLGGIIGFLCGTLTWVLFPFLPALLVGTFSLGFLLFITGVHHTDGLLDFGDAVMFHGSRERKLRIMRDPATGAGGFSLGLVVLLGTAISIASLNRDSVIPSLVGSEAAAKFAMLFLAWAGKSAHRGMNSPFVEAMHKKRGRWVRLGVGFVLLLIFTLSVLRVVGFLVAVAALLSAVLLLVVSKRHFGGITGDVMGAANDITRLLSLVVILVGSRWV